MALPKKRNDVLPTWWRLLLIAAATLVLCSCQGLPASAPDGPAAQEASLAASPGPAANKPPQPAAPVAAKPPAAPLPRTLPIQAWTGGPEQLIYNPTPPGQTWAPPGIARPWPRDEYLFDGGDRRLPATVDPDWTVRGLDPEDAIVHYDTLDGRTLVEPTNRVPIYAPRFAAVRRVTGLVQHRHRETATGVDLPTRLHRHDETQIASSVLQPVQPEGQLGMKAAGSLRERVPGLGVGTTQVLAGFESEFLAYEDLQVIRRGVFDGAEKPRLAQGLQAAQAWSHHQAVQVLIDEQLAYELSDELQPGEVFTYELPPGKPRVRVVKVASQDTARPGEVIDFTIRFDNIGDQPVGNVTIIDNLTTRLEYVPDSAQSSLEADFFTVENEVDSLILRWEIHDPVPVGQGGVIRFQCRVR